MLDNTSLQIEEMKIKLQKENPNSTTPYKDAIMEVRNQLRIDDPEELYESMHSILKEKLRQEFIDNKVFGKDSPYYKQSGNLTEFMSDK